MNLTLDWAYVDMEAIWDTREEFESQFKLEVVSAAQRSVIQLACLLAQI